jgi:hypothetical protein
MKQTVTKVLRRRGRGEVVERLQRHTERLNRQQARLDTLERRVAELLEELQEAQRLNKRIAELTDLVGEVLLPEGQRDDERIRSRLSAYLESM